MLEYRSLVKLKNTYLDNLTDYVNPKTGRIHGSFNQTGAETGRLSMSRSESAEHPDPHRRRPRASAWRSCRAIRRTTCC